MHDVLSGKAVTGIVVLYNKTPVDWYCKKQSTSETATYGSEFLSGRTNMEMAIDHRLYMMYLGARVNEQDYIWGDNNSMIKSSKVPDAKLHKRHNILSLHFIRSIITRGFINLQHFKSEYSLADILTKYLGYQDVYHKLIQPVVHHAGNTATLNLDDNLEVNSPE